MAHPYLGVRHGTTSEYRQGCRCAECRQAERRAEKRRNLRKLDGPLVLPARPSARLCEGMAAQGYHAAEIGRLASTSRQTITALLDGDTKTIRRSIAERIELAAEKVGDQHFVLHPKSNVAVQRESRAILARARAAGWRPLIWGTDEEMAAALDPRNNRMRDPDIRKARVQEAVRLTGPCKLTHREAAERMGVTPRTLERWLAEYHDQGELQAAS